MPTSRIACTDKSAGATSVRVWPCLPLKLPFFSARVMSPPQRPSTWAANSPSLLPSATQSARTPLRGMESLEKLIFMEYHFETWCGGPLAPVFHCCPYYRGAVKMKQSERKSAGEGKNVAI